METHFALFSLQDGVRMEVPQQYPFTGPWGDSSADNIPLREQQPPPVAFEMVFLSIVESCFYHAFTPINPEEMERLMEQYTSSQPLNLRVGMTPYGRVALWLGNAQKQQLLGWMTANVTDLSMSEFLPEQPNVTLKDYCKFYINADPLVKENLEKNGLPPRDLFDNYMKQFTYRYQMEFERWDEANGDWKKYEEEEMSMMPEFDYIEEALFDGTHDKLHDGGLMKYHEAGKPKKLAVQWHVKKSEWTAYFWFEDEVIRAIFDRFYGAHRDTKTDFILRFDPYNNKYELSLYRYGLREPLFISEKAYQLLVFKNKFECFRSKNYNQAKGAWIW